MSCPRGLIGFQDAGIAMLGANADIVKEVITSYKNGKLQELTEGCHQARHQRKHIIQSTRICHKLTEESQDALGRACVWGIMNKSAIEQR